MFTRQPNLFTGPVKSHAHVINMSINQGTQLIYNAGLTSYQSAQQICHSIDYYLDLIGCEPPKYGKSEIQMNQPGSGTDSGQYDSSEVEFVE